MVTDKVIYRILLCDDNKEYIYNRLRPSLEKTASSCANFDLLIDVATNRGQIVQYLRKNTYDLITLDVCYTNVSEDRLSVYENIRFSMDSYLYGVEIFYEEIRKNINTAVTKVIVVSNQPVDILRKNFNYDSSLDYFSKTNLLPEQIANHIVGYFKTGKQSLYSSTFVVYGHNSEMRNSIEYFLHMNNIHSIDLYHESQGGLNSFIDSLTDVANAAQCAIVLLSADDLHLNIEDMSIHYRARQNVIFEMGLFLGKLGKERIIVIHEKHEKFEFPSDIQGVFYVSYDKDKPQNWKYELGRRLSKIGFYIQNTNSLNSAISE